MSGAMLPCLYISSWRGQGQIYIIIIIIIVIDLGLLLSAKGSV
jgi:hypothetical protein